MVKKIRTKETEYAVKYLHEIKNMDSTAISLELGIAQAVVDGIIELTKPEDGPGPRKSKSQDLMIRHTSNKKTNNVSIMTEAASTLNDSLKKSIPAKQSQTFKDSIFRPNG